MLTFFVPLWCAPLATSENYMEAVGSIIITLGANGLGFPWETLVEVLILLLLLLCDVVFVDKGLLECHPKAAPASKNRANLSLATCFIM